MRFCNWAEVFRLRFKLQWEADLLHWVKQLDQSRWELKLQVCWGAIREWLVVDVEMPDGLPGRPEMGAIGRALDSTIGRALRGAN